MITTRVELLEKLLTVACRAALAEIDDCINEVTLDEFNFDQNDLFIINMENVLNEKEAQLVKEILKLAGWKNVTVNGDRVTFYL